MDLFDIVSYILIGLCLLAIAFCLGMIVYNFAVYLKERRITKWFEMSFINEFKEREKEMEFKTLKVAKESKIAPDIVKELKKFYKQGFKYLTKDLDGEIDLWKEKPQKVGNSWYLSNYGVYHVDSINLTNIIPRMKEKDNNNFSVDYIFDLSEFCKEAPTLTTPTYTKVEMNVCPRLEEYKKLNPMAKSYEEAIKISSSRGLCKLTIPAVLNAIEQLYIIRGSKDIDKIIQNKPYTIIKWKDGTTTKAKCNDNDSFDLRVGFAIAFTKKFFNGNDLDKVLREKLVLAEKKQLKITITNGRYEIKVLNPNLILKYPFTNSESIIITDGELTVYYGELGQSFDKKESQKYLTRLSNSIRDKDIELVKIAPKTEQFDLDKELKNWGIKPYEDFKIKILDITKPLNFSEKYTYFLNKRNKTLWAKEGTDFWEYNVSIEDLIMALVNKQVKIDFLEEENNLDKQLKDFGIVPYRRFKINTVGYSRSDLIYHIGSDKKVYFCEDNDYLLRESVNYKVEDILRSLKNEKTTIEFLDK